MVGKNDWFFVALSIIVVFFSCVAIVLTGGNIISGVVIIGLFMLIYIVPFIFKLNVFTTLMGFIALVMLLDIPASLPYYEHTAITEMLGYFVFESFKKITGAPFPFNAFELFAYFFALWVVFKKEDMNHKNLGNLILLSLLVPMVSILSTFLGLVRGNQISLAITQIRQLPLFVVYCYLGYTLLGSTQRLHRFLKLMVSIIVLKGFYALYVYVVVFKGDMGEREYLIDHLASFFLATAIFYIIAARFVFTNRSRYVFFYGLIILFMAIPYLLNDRRTSYLGVIVCMAITIIIVPSKYLKKLIPPTPILLGLMFLMILGVLVFLQSAFFREIMYSGTGAGGNIVSYRTIENFNLYNVIMRHTVLGLGFGARFPLVIDMPDISFVYDLYDAIPHNTVLYLWVFAGPCGIAALGTFLTFSISATVRVMNATTDFQTIIVAFVVFTMLVRWLMFVFFDIGLLEMRVLALVSLAAGAIIRIQESELKDA